VISLNVPLPPPDSIEPDRARFGLHPDRVWFGSSFEPQSDIARKNPYGVLQAFDLLSRTNSDAGLLIKVNNGIIDGRPHPVLEDLRARTRANPRISLLEDTLDYDSVLSLYASLDVFVSLHRSEGIGLALMETMALGKPVIATGWSGNMSFMDRSSACIVSHAMVPVDSDTHVYSRQVLGSTALWAEPDVTHAAEWMRVLASDPAMRAAIGRRAATAMHRYQTEARQAVFLDELRAIWDAEVHRGIGRAQRKARRDRLHRGLNPSGRRVSRLPRRLLHATSRLARWWAERRLHHIPLR
jgi:glycosyltransferase involved in cell wall biosynthesis